MNGMYAETGGHNGHTVYIRMPFGAVDRFVCVAMDTEAAYMIAKSLNEIISDRDMGWISRLPAIPKRTIEEKEGS